MIRRYRNRSLRHLLLRLSVVLALSVMLGTVHCGQNVPDEGPAMAMHHMEGASPMRHGALHQGDTAALCIALSAGAHAVEGPDLVAWHADFALAGWTMDAVPVRADYHPDPAQRPPDPTSNA